jgi:hypothetical protein
MLSCRRVVLIAIVLLAVVFEIPSPSLSSPSLTPHVEAFDWASFDLGNIEGENQSVIEQDVVLPQGFNWDWFK